MKTKYNAYQNFINRDLSWLEFNERVLKEAQDSDIPLFERLKFLAIVSSNLEEFFMVRVASLRDKVLVGYDQRDASGLLPQENLHKIADRAHRMVDDKYHCYRSLLKALKKEKIHFLNPEGMDKEQLKFIQEYYMRNVYPVLTPACCGPKQAISFDSQ